MLTIINYLFDVFTFKLLVFTVLRKYAFLINVMITQQYK